jgi:hypothetical protein
MKYNKINILARHALGVGIFFIATTAHSAVLLFDDFSNDIIADTSDETGQTVDSNYWRIYTNTSTISPSISEANSLLTISSGGSRGAGITLDYTNLNTRSVNGVDPALSFFPPVDNPSATPKVVITLEGITIDGNIHPSNHELRLIVASNGAAPYRRSMLMVSIAGDRVSSVTSSEYQSDTGNYPRFPARYSLVPSFVALAAMPSTIELVLTPTDYEITMSYTVQGVEGAPFQPLVGGSVRYFGEHGLTQSYWENSWDFPTQEGTESVGAAIHIGAVSGSPSGRTTVTLDKITVTDGQP